MMEIKLFSEVIKLDIGVKTDAGKIRDNNQDAYYLSSDKSKPLFIIADGMGGHKAGEIASKLAIDTISQNFNNFLDINPLNEEDIKNNIFKSFSEANVKI